MAATSAALGRRGRQPSQAGLLVVWHPPSETLTASRIIKASDFIIGLLATAEIVEGGGILLRPFLGAADGQQPQGYGAERDSEPADPKDGSADIRGGEEREDVHAGTGARAGQIAGMT